MTKQSPIPHPANREDLPATVDVRRMARVRHSDGSMAQHVAARDVPDVAREVPNGVPPADVPMAKVEIPKLTRLKTRYLKVVLSKEEYELYMDTWIEWFTNHPEYTMAEDRVDVRNICMETVIQFRLDLVRQEYKFGTNPDLEAAYGQSHRRMQTARENLLARRSDRAASRSGPTTNVAILVSGVSEEKLVQMQQQAQQDKDGAMKFLQATKESTQQLATLGSPREVVAEQQAKEVDDGEAEHPSGEPR